MPLMAPSIQLSGDIYSKCNPGEKWRSKHYKNKLCNMPDRAKVHLPFGLKIEAAVQRKLVSRAWGRFSLPPLPGGCGRQVGGNLQRVCLPWQLHQLTLVAGASSLSLECAHFSPL